MTQGKRESWRRRAGAFLTDGFFQGSSDIGRRLPLADPARHHVEVIRDIAYRDGGLAEHRLDIYRPAGQTGPWPVALYLHGGAFRILSKDTHWLFGLIFARRGYLTINASYRLAPDHPYPAAHEDAAAALLWTLREVSRFGGDPARLVIAGESAGANLATSLAVASAWRRPEPWAREVFDAGAHPGAVMAACGVLQVSDTDRFRRAGGISWFTLDRLAEMEDAYLPDGPPDSPRPSLCDPLLVLERAGAPERPLAPFFAPVGGWDVLKDDTRRLSEALDRLGVPCEPRYFPREIHAFHAFIFRKPARRCWTETFEFLHRHVPAAGTGPG